METSPPNYPPSTATEGRVVARRRRVAVVDDDDDVRALLAFAFASEGCDVMAAASGGELMDRLRPGPGQENVPDVVVSDLNMLGGDGLDLLRRMQELSPRPATILITGFVTDYVRHVASQLGAVAVLTKPINIAALIETAINRSLP